MISHGRVNFFAFLMYVTRSILVSMILSLLMIPGLLNPYQIPHALLSPCSNTHGMARQRHIAETGNILNWASQIRTLSRPIITRNHRSTAASSTVLHWCSGPFLLNAVAVAESMMTYVNSTLWYWSSLWVNTGMGNNGQRLARVRDQATLHTHLPAVVLQGTFFQQRMIYCLESRRTILSSSRSSHCRSSMRTNFAVLGEHQYFIL